MNNINKALLYFVIFIMVMPLRSFATQRFDKDQKKGGNYSGMIEFHKQIHSGSTTYYDVDTDSALIQGANDSVYSVLYYNPRGYSSVGVEISGGSSISIGIKIQQANAGEYAKDLKNVPDSYFKDAYWLKAGAGLSNNVIATSENLITATGKYLPVDIPVGDKQLFRIIVYSSGSHSGTTTVKLRAYFREED